MDIRKLAFDESITVTDANGNTIAASVASRVEQHLTGMRDPVADIKCVFKAIGDITDEWNGVPGSVRLTWRGNVVYWAYAMQHYNKGDHSALFCSPAGSPSLDPPTGTSISGSAPHKRYTGIVTQSGAAAPVAFINENGINSALIWSRLSTGIYQLKTPANAEVFIGEKTVIQATQMNGEKMSVIYDDPTVIELRTGNSSGVLTDSLLNCHIQIKVYI